MEMVYLNYINVLKKVNKTDINNLTKQIKEMMRYIANENNIPLQSNRTIPLLDSKVVKGFSEFNIVYDVYHKQYTLVPNSKYNKSSQIVCVNSEKLVKHLVNFNFKTMSELEIATRVLMKEVMHVANNK